MYMKNSTFKFDSHGKFFFVISSFNVPFVSGAATLL